MNDSNFSGRGNESAQRAQALLAGLLVAGVREIALCPGSRSAPLAYAALAATRAGRARLHVRVDERSAGFLALGLAKRSRVPAAVITTSGTAVANLHPAVLEAHHAFVPLIVISADRPRELRDTGANQTTTQPGIFGPAVAFEADLPDDPDTPLRSWRDAAEAAYAAATAYGHAGPVHLNAPFREPLVPALDQPWAAWPEGVGPGVTSAATEPGGVSPVEDWGGLAPAGSPTEMAADPLVAGMPPMPERTLVVVGDLPEPGQVARALAWADAHGWPVIAEPFGPHPRTSVPHGVLVLGSAAFLDEHPPEGVVVIGRPTLSRPVTRLINRPDIALVHLQAGTTFISAAHPQAPSFALDTVLGQPAIADANGTDIAQAQLVAPAHPPARSAWSTTWHDAGRAVAQALATHPSLRATTDDQPGIDYPVGRRARGPGMDGSVPIPDPVAMSPGWAVVRAAVSALPEDSLLFVGSSKSVRDLDVIVPGQSAALDIVASRGLAGIDGCLSTAVGLALAESSGRPCYALLGDLTFLHDSNGLIIGPDEPRPDLTILVLNDDGGGIFTLLEPGAPQRTADFQRLFATPTRAELGQLCAGYRVPHSVAEDLPSLIEQLRARPRGIRVIEVRLDRARHRRDQEELQALADHAVAAAATAEAASSH
ncbi:MAG: 2-succinyl-5-enolpyruvyl-6-hydroxy-3-cyclohexene-1-carboxylic-acid synthase [Nostocoides sp.]